MCTLKMACLLETILIRAIRMTQDNNVVDRKKQNNELKDPKMLCGVEGNCKLNGDSLWSLLGSLYAYI